MRAEPMDTRVLHVTWQMSIGGAERSVYQSVREQRNFGYNADLLICSASSGFYGDKVEGTGAKVYVLGQKKTYDMSIRRKARNILQQYDIVHFHGAEIGVMYIAAGIPLLARFYTHRSGAFRYPLKKRIYYELVGYILRRHFRRVSSISLHARKATSDLFRIPVSNISVTYNAIDASSLAPKLSKDEVLAQIDERLAKVVRVGTSGNLRPWKRIDRLIKAFCPPPFNDLHCYIIGSGPSLPELKALVKNLDLTERVKFLSQTNHIGDYLQLMDVFVVPSGPEEAFGNSAVESMAMGIPTIVFSDGGGLVEHIDDGVSGYIVNDLNELRKRLQQLATDLELRRRIGDAGMRAVREKYGLGAMVARYNDFYGFRV